MVTDYSNYLVEEKSMPFSSIGGLNLNGSPAWIIISAIVAIIGALLIYFIFLNRKNENRFKGFGKWLYNILNFRKLFLEGFLKILYLISTIFLTLAAFSFIKESILEFLAVLILGNLVLNHKMT